MSALKANLSSCRFDVTCCQQSFSSKRNHRRTSHPNKDGRSCGSDLHTYTSTKSSGRFQVVPSSSNTSRLWASAWLRDLCACKLACSRPETTTAFAKRREGRWSSSSGPAEALASGILLPLPNDVEGEPKSSGDVSPVNDRPRESGSARVAVRRERRVDDGVADETMRRGRLDDAIEVLSTKYSMLSSMSMDLERRNGEGRGVCDAERRRVCSDAFNGRAPLRGVSSVLRRFASAGAGRRKKMLRRNASGDKASDCEGRERSPCRCDAFALGATLCLCVGIPNTVVSVCQR